jgi:hypothetical protein
MPVKNIHSYNTIQGMHAARCNFYLPKIRIHFGKFTFKYSASVLWENIRVSLKKYQRPAILKDSAKYIYCETKIITLW